MADKPILFSAPMVRAILAGTKTQTRRPLRTGTWWTAEHGVIRMAPAGLACTGFARVDCPYGQAGDRLWVRETWAAPHKFDGHQPAHIPALTRWHYAADEDRAGLRWRPSIHMPRCASRITLDVLSVRVERLQDISAADALAEGIEHYALNGKVPIAGPGGLDLPGAYYRYLWESINGPDSWDANPFVWVVEFKRAGADWREG